MRRPTASGIRPESRDDRCHVCGERVYMFWVDDEPHNNECMYGEKIVTDCQRAMSVARDRAARLKDPVWQEYLRSQIGEQAAKEFEE